ncbi:hypothetical protein [Nostoc sp. CENA543]|uniref:hypothetical protein n=1 Tax=Nostoc sp. CENA543 TaxID=1869241 RepID=UPI0018642480|nr:hypothetical protein [Nostoc sp. CENA543]
MTWNLSARLRPRNVEISSEETMLLTLGIRVFLSILFALPIPYLDKHSYRKIGFAGDRF